MRFCGLLCRQPDQQNDDKRFCIQAVRSQQMSTWLTHLRAHVGVAARHMGSDSRREISERTGRNLDKINEELRRLDMISSTEYSRR